MTNSHHAVLGLFFAILGSCLGSFLNVCAYRIPLGMSVLHPRSRCPCCGHAILARDNLPILGWLFLRGRCRRCRCAIPSRYAVVELAVGVLFALPYLVMAAVAGGDPWERLARAGSSASCWPPGWPRAWEPLRSWWGKRPALPGSGAGPPAAAWGRRGDPGLLPENWST